MSLPKGQRTANVEPTTQYLRRGEGRRVWLNGDLYTIKVGGERSRGAMTLIEASVPPGGGPPLHTHDVEDEAFYVIDGVLAITAGDQQYDAGPGDFVYIPHGTVHAFRNNGALPARQLLIFTPGYYEASSSKQARTSSKASKPHPAIQPTTRPSTRSARSTARSRSSSGPTSSARTLHNTPPKTTRRQNPSRTQRRRQNERQPRASRAYRAGHRRQSRDRRGDRPPPRTGGRQSGDRLPLQRRRG